MPARGYVVPGGRTERDSEALAVLWREGACTESDPKLWQVEGSEDSQKEEAATLWEMFCRRCPVKDSCLEYALTHTEAGVWAGTTERIRRRLRKARKDTAA